MIDAVVIYPSGQAKASPEFYKYARVVELVDSLDSGSSAHSGHAGSSPASRTKETVERLSLFLPVHRRQNVENPCVSWKKEPQGYFLFSYGHLHLFVTISTHFRRPRRPAAVRSSEFTGA